MRFTAPVSLFVLGLLVSAGAVASSPQIDSVEYDLNTPREVSELIGIASTWTPAEVGELAHFLKVEEYWMVEDPVFFLGEGMARMDAEMVPIGEDGYTTVTGKVTDGIWVNVTDSYLFVAGMDGDPFEIAPGYIVAVGSTIPWKEVFEHSIADPESLNAGERGCRVTCGDGFYACCNGAGCRCRSSSSSSQGCSSGGVGAVSCELIKSKTSLTP